MFALALHYLNGWAMAAADGAKKQRAEWPPHPDRVYMALSAAYFETEDGDKAAERAALEWLEELPPPALDASESEKRDVVTHYVPINDSAISGRKKVMELVAAAKIELAQLKDAGLSQLPEFRGRQPRAFPVAIPHRPVIHLIWPDTAPPEPHRHALSALCRKVTHVGHSASFVQMWVEDAPPEPEWVPNEGLAVHRLRVPGKGRLTYLEARCNRERAIGHVELQNGIEDLDNRVNAAKGKDKKALQMELEERRQALQIEFPGGAPVPALDPKLFRPEPGLWQGYARPLKETTAPVPGSVFDPNLVVLSISDHRLTLPSTLKLLEALRNAVMKYCPRQPPPEWLSGHTPEGKPSGAPHLAFLPLPFVGREHSDCKLMGVALALPRDLDAAEADRCLGALLRDESGLPQSIRLFDGQWFDCQAEWETRESPPWNLRPETWTGPARRWASVTPVVLDRHFDGKDKWEQAAESVKTACERIGLPSPREVLLHPVSMFEGVPRGNEFPPITRKSDGGRMHHAHAVIVFDEDVIGPVLVGAGRFRGYGLCRPLPQGGEDA